MRKLISAFTLGALMLLPDYGFTLGLGEIEVNSALNQQLNAKIGLLSSSPEDAETLIIKLASREEFVRAGLDRPYGLNDLKFKPVVEDGKVYIKVTTGKPVREPFLNFLVEVDWPKGHMLREYTILLDPPVFMGQQAAPAAAPAEESRPAARPQSAAPAPAQSFNEVAEPDSFRPVAVASVPAAAPVAAPAEVAPVSQPQTYAPVPVQQQTSYSSPSGDYRVQAGDTAWSLADSMRPDQSVSVQQMLLAMLRINPEVFINGNVNGLKKGYILRVPDRSDITSVTQAEARAIVGEQNALWKEYQQSLAVDEPASSMDVDVEEGEEAEYGSGIESGDDSRLSIVSAGDGSEAGETKDPTEMSAEELREQLALAREELETARVENEGLEGDLGSLEEKVDQLQSLIEIEDDAMAEIQSVAEGEDAEVIDEEEVDVTEEDALAALDELTGETDVTEGDVVEEEIIEGEEVVIEEQEESGIITEAEEIDAATVKPVKKAPRVTTMPREEQGLVASLLGNPLITGGVALLGLILLAVGYILIKRRRDSAGEDAEATLAADLEHGLGDDLEDVADSIDDAAMDDFVSDEEVEDSMAEAEAEAKEQAEESFDSEATMILPSTEDTLVTPAEPQAAAEEEEERDDVIAEADVYLAYGIYQQAEELLQNAINDNPEKDSYRVKLAETYFAGKNTEALAKLGAEMKAKLAGEDTPAWQKVAAMGKELCPDDEVFQHAGAVADLDIDDLMPKSPEPMDFDLGDDSAGDTPELDIDFDVPAADSAVSVDETIAIPDPGSTAIIPPDEVPAAEEAAETDLGDLEFDIGETEAEEPAAAEEEFSLDIEASELDIEDEAETPAEEDSVEIDSSELDFDMGLDDDSSVSEPEAPAAGGDVDLSELGDVDEINTKLDLAKAYMDMGDHEGARDILDEVVAGGDDAQKKEAQELLSQVDK